MFKRLKIESNQSDLLDIYFKQIRSIAEFAVPVWNSSLTGEDVANIESGPEHHTLEWLRFIFISPEDSRCLQNIREEK